MGRKIFKKFLLLSMAATLVFGSAVSASAATSSPTQGQEQQETTKKAATVKKKSTIGNASKKTIKVNYKASNATKVVIQYRVTGGKWKSKTVSASGTSYTLTGLKANKLYEIRVVATGEDGKTVKTGVSRRYIAGDKASKITAKKKAAVVKWKKVKGATGYQIRYSTNKNMKDYKVVYVKGASKVSKKIKNLKSKKRYYVQVRPYITYNGKKYLGISIAKKSVKVK